MLRVAPCIKKRICRLVKGKVARIHRSRIRRLGWGARRGARVSGRACKMSCDCCSPVWCCSQPHVCSSTSTRTRVFSSPGCLCLPTTSQLAMSRSTACSSVSCRSARACRWCPPPRTVSSERSQFRFQARSAMLRGDCHQGPLRAADAVIEEEYREDCQDERGS